MGARLGLGLLLALSLSCRQEAARAPALPDYSAAQQKIWSQVPAGDYFGLTVAAPAHFLERLRTLRDLAATGPVTKKWIERGTAEAVKLLGFDPLDAAAWAAQGVALDAPLGFFYGKDKQALLLLKASDATKAAALVQKLNGNEHHDVACAPHDAWLACSTQ